MSAAINEELGTSGVIWNTGDLYSGYDDSQIEKDISSCQKEAAAINREYAGKVKVTKLNTDQNQQTARQYSIQSIPTLLFFKNGKLVNRQVGALPKPEIERLLRAVL